MATLKADLYMSVSTTIHTSCLLSHVWGVLDQNSYIMVMVAQLCERTKNHWIVYFKWGNCIACGLCLSKARSEFFCLQVIGTNSNQLKKKGELIPHVIEKSHTRCPGMTRFWSQTITLNPRCLLCLSALLCGSFSLRKTFSTGGPWQFSAYIFTNLATLAEVSPAKVLGLNVIGLVWVTWPSNNSI